MPDTDTIPVSASIASTGKGLIYAHNGYWAGWSGEETLAVNTEVKLFDFTSPNAYLLTEIIFSANIIATSANDIQFKILLNDLIVYNVYETAAVDRGGNLGEWPKPKLIIPPNNEVDIIMRQDESVSVTAAAIIIAREL